MFFEGTIRVLFSLLFGVGTYIILDRLSKRDAGIKAADIYFRRLLWMLVFGLIHGYLLLWTYRDHKSNKKLVADVALAQTKKAQGEELSKELKEATAEWGKNRRKKSPKHVAEVNENMRKGYLHLVGYLASDNMATDTRWFYRYNLWDVQSMILLGIAFFKWNMLSGKKSYRFYGLMVLIGYAVGLTTNYFEVTSRMSGNFSFLAFSKTNISYDLGRVGIAIGHIGLIMIFTKLPILGWLKTRIAAVGKMALTNYIMHSLICMVIFTGVGFGLFGKLQRYELYYIVFAVWIFQLILSPIWLKYFYFELMEWLWRRLSYQYKPPFSK